MSGVFWLLCRHWTRKGKDHDQRPHASTNKTVQHKTSLNTEQVTRRWLDWISSLNDTDQYGGDGQYQQNVYKASQRVGRHHSQQPQDH